MNGDHAAAHTSQTLELTFAIVVGSTASLILNTLPVFLTTITRMLGFGESQAGQIAFVELGGMATGTIVLAVFPSLVQLVTWRGLACCGLTLFAAANFASSYISAFPMFIAMRFFAGLGTSLSLAIVYAAIADVGGARSYAIFNVIQLASGWLGIVILSDLSGHAGFVSVLRYLALLSCLAIVLALKLRGGNHTQTIDLDEALPYDPRAGILTVVGVFVYFCGMGSMYAFLGYMGRSWGGDPQAVDLEVSMTVIAAMLGGLAAAGLGMRYGLKPPLRLGYFVLIVSIVVAASFHPVRYFAVIISVFAFSWNVVTPFQFAVITSINRSSSIAMWVNVALLCGLAVGPEVAGLMITPSFNYVTLLALALGLVSWICVEIDLLLFPASSRS